MAWDWKSAGVGAMGGLIPGLLGGMSGGGLGDFLFGKEMGQVPTMTPQQESILNNLLQQLGAARS